MSNLYNSVNIIGYGYVGGAIGYLCKKNQVPYCTYDVLKKDEPESVGNFNDISSLIKSSEQTNEHNFYFICVPTPPKDDTGECDTSIVEHVLDQLFCETTRKTSVIIKSTIKPGTSRTLHNKYGKKLNIVFCPEFLKEKTFQEDMYNADFCLLGTECDTSTRESVEGVMRRLYSHKTIDVIHKSYEECELFKYTINVFLSVKVWYFNEISEVCNRFGVDYNNLKDLFPLEPRIGESHIDVPGHDGSYGFGGKCLPKETLALSNLQRDLGLPNGVLSEILERNNYFRTKKD
jgi:nucleotide sugar dehydrogenase